MPPDRVPVLPQQDDVSVVVQRQDGDRTRVVDDLADAVAAARHRDGVPAQRDDPALVDRLALQHPELVGRHGHQMPTLSPSSSGSRADSW